MGKIDRFFINESAPETAKPKRAQNDRNIHGLPGGTWISKGVYRIEYSYRLGDMYGNFPLAAPETMEVMRYIGARGSIVFLDLETTGLSGGAGTYAFLCGLGSTRGDFFYVTQYFLKSPAYEAEWLGAIDSDIPAESTLATYNGLTFDIPILLTRHVMTRTRAQWESSPHIDLLRYSRRLYRGYLESCALGEIERGVLGVRRSGEDVPGYLIPDLYRRYLSSGDASALGGVFYHNRLDIVSLAALYCHVARVLEGTSGSGRELIRAGDFWRDRGFAGDAVRLWEMAEADPGARIDSFVRRALLAKKKKSYASARDFFERALEEFRAGARHAAGDLLLVLEELAKLEEHRFMDRRRALGYVQTALNVLRKARLYGGVSNADLTRAMEHRRTRLEKKILLDGKCRNDE